MVKRICVMVMALTAMMALLSAASVFAWPYFEGFEGVLSGSSITALGWTDKISGKDMKVESGYHAGSGWTGNCARGNTSSLDGEYYEPLGAGVPTTGLLRLSARAWSPNPYAGVNYYYGSGSVGLGDTAGNMLVSWWGGSSNYDLWQLDCRPMGGGTYNLVKQGIRDIFENDLTVQLQILVDMAAKQVWGVVDNGKGVREETTKFSYTSAPIASVYLFESNYDWKDYGIDVDDISVASYSASLLVSAEPHTSYWMSSPVTIPANEEFVVSIDFTYSGSTKNPAIFTIYKASDSSYLWSSEFPALSQGANHVRLTVPARPLSSTSSIKLELKGNLGQTVMFDRILMAGMLELAQPQSPENGTVTASRRPTFQWWGASGASGNYTLLIGSDPGITRDVRRFTVSGATSLTLADDLPMYSWWFWTVMPNGSDISEADFLKLTEIRSLGIAYRGTAADTTPPHLYRMRPALESTSAMYPLISVKWLESGGSGIDTSSAHLLVDGATAPGTMQFTSGGMSLQMTSPLSSGRHRATFEISDNAGNKSTATWQFWYGQRAPSVVTLDQNGWILFNDLPFFPISHYTYTYRDTNMTRDIDYPDSGFNTIINCFNFNTALSYGLKGTQVLYGFAYRGMTQQQIEAEIVSALAGVNCDTSHPAWLGCWMDEEWNSSDILPLLQAYDNIANGHLMMPVGYGAWIFVYYPDNLTDIFVFDSYPIPTWPITDHGDGLEAVRGVPTAAGNALHLWSAAFDWIIWQEVPDTSNFDYQRDVVNNPALAGHYFRPSPRELFASAALGWVHGAYNAGWWGPTTELIPEQRENMKSCARRASWLAPVLMSDPPAQPSTLRTSRFMHYVQLASSKPAIEWMERQYDGKRYIIAVNVDSEPVSVSFTVPGMSYGTRIKVLWEDRELRSGLNVFQDVVPGVGACIYEM